MSSGNPVLQTGTITPGHAAQWTTDGVVQDAGHATSGSLTEVGITNNGNIALAINSGGTIGEYAQLGFGISNNGTTATTTVYVESYNGAPDNDLIFNINGTSYPFNPSGGGNITGPGSSVSGDLLAFNGTGGNLVKDTGVQVSAIAPSVATVAALEAATSTTLPNSQCYLVGYHSAGDGGEGTFVIGTSTTANGGTIINDASSRSWYRQTNGMPYSVKWFGAYGSGSNDDTTAIQNAISAAISSTKYAVYFPTGVYMISSLLTITGGAPVELIGNGAANSVIYQSSSTAGGIAFQAAASSFWTGGGIQGLRITAANVVNPGTVMSTGTGLLIESANDVFSVRDLDVNAFATGIDLEGCWNTRWDTFRVFTFTDYGLVLNQNTSYPDTGGNLFRGALITNGSNSAGAGGSSGTYIVQSSGDYFTNVECDSCFQGWVINPGTNQSVSFSFFDQCLADTNTSIGWNFNAVDSGSNIYSIRCTGCWSSFNGAQGILVTGSNTSVVGVRWVGGAIRENEDFGALINGGVAVAIQDAEITANGRTLAAGSGYGVAVGPNVNGISVTNNTLGNFGSAFSNQASSVFISSGTGTDIVVLGNVTIGTLSGGAQSIVNNASGTVVVANNVGP